MIKVYDIKLYKNDKLEKEYNSIKGLSDKKRIILKLDDTKTIVNEKEFIRENDEYKFSIDFNNNKSIIHLKEHNLSYDIKVLDAKYTKKEKEIEIKYKIETDEDLIKIIIVESMWLHATIY